MLSDENRSPKATEALSFISKPDQFGSAKVKLFPLTSKTETRIYQVYFQPFC